MDARPRAGLRSLLALFPLLAATTAVAQPDGLTEQVLVQRAAIQLLDIQADPTSSIPASVVAEAEGVALFPDVVKAGFVIGARIGHGMILLRLPDGTWSQPVFLTLTGGSIGLQAGVASSDVVLVFRNRQSIERFLLGRGTLALNGDASIALGPRGNGVGGATNLKLSADVLAYGRNRGFFAGISGGGSSISIARRRNLAYYGQAGLSPNAILTSAEMASTPEVDDLHRVLMDLEGVVVEEPAAPPSRPAPAPVEEPAAPAPTAERRIIRSTPASRPTYVAPEPRDSLVLDPDPDFSVPRSALDALDPPSIGAPAASARSFTRPQPHPFYFDLPAPRPRPIATPIKPPADPAPGVEAPPIEPPKATESTERRPGPPTV